MQAPAVKMENIVKRFGSIVALDDMNFEAFEGEITAIVGDNGSGKSTLIQILTGNLKPDAGTIEIRGRLFSSLTIQQAMELGMSAVYQDLALDDQKDGAENLFLGRERMRYGIFLDHRRMRQEAEAVFRQLRIDIPDVRQRVEKMSGGQRQAIAIARAVEQNGSIMIFDEPTSAMGMKETERILHLFRSLKEKGKTIILISHHLFQVFDIADRINVFKNGRSIASFRTEDSSPAELYGMLIEKEECNG